MKNYREELLFKNEFACIRLTLEKTQCGTRLRIKDLETGASTYLDPIELSSLCEWPEERRTELIRVGIYGSPDEARSESDE